MHSPIINFHCCDANSAVLAFHLTAMTWLVYFVFTARPSFYSCLTVSQLVNTSDSGELTQQARQRQKVSRAMWHFKKCEPQVRGLLPAPGGPGAGVGRWGNGEYCSMEKLNACTRGLVKRAQAHVIIVSDIWVQGCHCRSTNLTLNDWHDMLWGASLHVDKRKQLVSFHSHHGESGKLPTATS